MLPEKMLIILVVTVLYQGATAIQYICANDLCQPCEMRCATFIGQKFSTVETCLDESWCKRAIGVFSDAFRLAKNREGDTVSKIKNNLDIKKPESKSNPKPKSKTPQKTSEPKIKPTIKPKTSKAPTSKPLQKTPFPKTASKPSNKALVIPPKPQPPKTPPKSPVVLGKKGTATSSPKKLASKSKSDEKPKGSAKKSTPKDSEEKPKWKKPSPSKGPDLPDNPLPAKLGATPAKASSPKSKTPEKSKDKSGTKQVKKQGVMLLPRGGSKKKGKSG